MTRKRRRLTTLLAAMTLLALAAALVLNAFQEHLVFFYSPSDLVAKAPSPGQRIRIGGLVEDGSVQRQADGITVAFRVTDLAESVPVSFTAILPDQFREGQGVVIEGALQDGVFLASNVLAKHDETYMPPEVADALKKSGQWRGAEPAE